ncbi:phosphatase [Vibrio phage VAP7]|uniref:Phosphatase n=1 Tax=Vibrio phage VAP7 TaxID=2584487 RepID=A0A4Y5TV29_9CAUD|nr:phosphatase [Vibrio phage VAP7]QDB73213.1 phosphatase [Vibrio phage VAP7]
MKNYPIIRIADVFKALEAGEHTHFGHGCNCRKQMHRDYGGGGVAAMVADWCPEAFEVDRMTSGDNRLGTYTSAVKKVESGNITVLNMYSQYESGQAPLLTLAKGISNSLDKVKLLIDDNTKSLAIPAIGCGIAGGSISMLVSTIQFHNIPNLYLYLHPDDTINILDLLYGKVIAKFEDGYGLIRVMREPQQGRPLYRTMAVDKRFHSVEDLLSFARSLYGSAVVNIPNLILDVEYLSLTTTQEY